MWYFNLIKYIEKVPHMNTAIQPDNESNLYTAAFCIVIPAAVCAAVLPFSSGVYAAIVIAIAVAFWVRAAKKAHSSMSNGGVGTLLWNAAALALVAFFIYKLEESSQATRFFAWLVALQLPAYLVAIFVAKKNATTAAPQARVMQGTNTSSASTPEYDEQFYLREEQKIIAQQKNVRTPSRTFQNKAEPVKSNFKSITGMKELKERLYASYKEMFLSVTTKGADKRNGILLYGEPGNGKTFFAECLAGQIGWPIIKCTFGDVNSRWVGETTEKVVQVFEDAMEQAPCVLFIDEIDALLVRRDQITQAESETGKTVNTILTKLVEARDHMVLVVAATNFIDRLDSAAIREGRFDYKVEVPPPDLSARRGLLRNDLKRHAPAAKLDQEAIDRIALRWEGFSVSRIKAVAFETAKLAKAEKRSTIDFDCLKTALRITQGNLGDRLPENAKSLDQMQFDEDVRITLNGLAVRMRDIDEIERMGGSVPSGVLFYGPPGTGKTATVRALAKSSGWALLTTSGKDLNSSDNKIDEIYTKARNIRPCIVFIDEADDILADRQTSWNKSMTNKLLSVIDGAGGKSHDILWVAATNHPDSIDSAALRGGRFTEKIEFRLPSAKVVEKFVREWDEKNPASLDASLTYEHVAAYLNGQSIANIEAIMQASVNSMIARTAGGGERVVSMPDLEVAYSTVVGE